MNHVSPVGMSAATQHAPAPPTPSALNWVSEVLNFARRRWWVVMLAALAFSALAIGYALSARTGYSAVTTLLIDTRKLHPFRQQTLVGVPGSEGSFIESQVQIITSDEVTLATVRRLNLLDNPIFTGEALPPLGGVAGVLADLRALPRELIARFRTPSAEPGEATSLAERELRAAAALASMVRARRVGSTAIVTIRVTAPAPALAAELANAMAQTYIDTQLAVITDSTRRASAWLEDRMSGLREAALNADRELTEYRVRNNIITTDRGLINEQQLQELSTQLTNARARVSEAEARLGRIQPVAMGEMPDGAVTEMLQIPLVTQLRGQLLELTRREADFAQRFGQNHGSVLQLRNEMSELRRSLASEARRLLDTARTDLAGAREAETQILRNMDNLVQQWAATNTDQIRLRSLEGVATAYRQLFENFLVRYTQVVQDESYPISDARIVSQATAPLSPSEPSRLLVLLAGLMAGLTFGFVLAMLLEAADRCLRTPAQARAATGIDCIGLIPDLRIGVLGNDPAALMREVIGRPNSRFSEAMLGLQTRVARNCTRTRDVKVIAVVGLSKGAGTSTVAAALAMCLAQSGRRTVLVDCDLRRASLSEALAPDSQLGFTDVFADRATLAEALLTDAQGGMRLLPAGQREESVHPATILGSERARIIIGQLRADHEIVLLDLPSLGPQADAHAAIASADGVLIVLEWGGPGPDEIHEVLSRFDRGNTEMLGTVLNKINVGKASRYLDFGGAAYIKAV